MKILPLFGLIVVVALVVAAYWTHADKVTQCPYGPIVICEHHDELPLYSPYPSKTWPRP
jgi:hypothetical protein